MTQHLFSAARLGAATTAALFAIAFTSGCGDDPCDEYVNYICDCGGACDEARNTYEGADAKLQEQCENELQQLQDADDAAGAECASLEGTDTGA